jgi:hypothetical protein
MERQQLVLLILLMIGLYYFMFQNESFSNSCDKKSCNNKMNEFVVEKGWSFKDSSKLFKECQHCDSKWYRHSEYKTSDNGNKWSQHSSSSDAFKSIKLD